MPPSILFVHIPVHAALIAQTSSPYKDDIGVVTNETPQNYRISQRRYPGLNDDYPISSQGGESDLPYAGQDRAFIDAFIQSAAGHARVHGIVSGHDHGNDVSHSIYSFPCNESQMLTLSALVVCTK